MPSVVPWKAYKNEHYRARGFTVAGPESVAVRRRAPRPLRHARRARASPAQPPPPPACHRFVLRRALAPSLPRAPLPPSQGWPAVPPPAGAAAYPEIFQHLGVRVNPADVLNHGPVFVARAGRVRPRWRSGVPLRPVHAARAPLPCSSLSRRWKFFSDWRTALPASFLLTLP